MHHSENTYNQTKMSTVGESCQHCQPELQKTASWSRAGQAQDIASGPNTLIESKARTTAVHLKRNPYEISRYWVNKYACSLSHNILVIFNSFVTVNEISELFRKIRSPHNFSKSPSKSSSHILYLVVDVSQKFSKLGHYVFWNDHEL